MTFANFLSPVRCIVALIAGSFAVDAAPMFFTDEAAFNAAVAAIPSSLNTDSYEDLSQGWVFGPLDRGDYTVVNGGNQIFVVNNPLDATDGSMALIMGVPARPGIFQFASPIVAFSIDASDVLSILGGDLTVQIDNGPAQAILSGQFGSRNKQFLGIVDTSNPFTGLSFDSTDIADTWAFDRAQYAFAPAAVPEPSTYLLIATGVAAMYLRRRVREARR